MTRTLGGNLLYRKDGWAARVLSDAEEGHEKHPDTVTTSRTRKSALARRRPMNWRAIGALNGLTVAHRQQIVENCEERRGEVAPAEPPSARRRGSCLPARGQVKFDGFAGSLRIDIGAVVVAEDGMHWRVGRQLFE